MFHVLLTFITYSSLYTYLGRFLNSKDCTAKHTRQARLAEDVERLGVEERALFADLYVSAEKVRDSLLDVSLGLLS